MKAYLFNLLISIDQFFNTLFLGNPDETISSRMGKAIRDGECWGCSVVCKVLDFFDPNHCKDSIEEDEHAPY